MTKETNLYRPNIGIMVINNEGKVLMCKRTDITDNAWQMPQGGIDENEDPKKAGLRELYEETHISAPEIEIIDLWDEFQYYEIPKEKLTEYSETIGQKQKWLIVRYLKDYKSIDLSKAQDNEFNDYQWLKINQAIELIWQPKQHIYKNLANKYADILA